MTDPQLEDAIFAAAPQPEDNNFEDNTSEDNNGEDNNGEDNNPAYAGSDEAESDQAEGRPRKRRGRRDRSKPGPGRRWVALLVALAVLVGGGIVAVQFVAPIVHAVTHRQGPPDFAGNGTGHAVVVISPGDSGDAIATTLAEGGVVKSAAAFTDAAADNPAFAAIAPGTYTLRRGMSAASALTLLLDPASRSTVKVTIREGMWTSEIFAALSKSTGVPVGDYAKVDPKAVGLPAAAHGKLDGYLFPATYSFEPKTTATEQVRTMVTKAISELTSLGVAPAQMQRTLTIASIVEAEAKASADRPKVARVIENRLAQKMKLQMDSTVHFIAHRRGGAATTDKERANPSPYNTYVHLGLPPGPINSPGASAIKAAAAPAKGPWLYFVAVNPVTGETRFATTFAEQQANEKLFQQWCQAHKDKC